MTTQCPLCEKDLLEGAERTRTAATLYMCKGCGRFILEAEFDASKVLGSRFTYPGSVEPEERLRLRGAVRRATDLERAPMRLDLKNYKTVIADNPLPDPCDQPDQLLFEVGRRCRWDRPTRPEHGEAWAARLFFPDWLTLKTMINAVNQVVVHNEEGGTGVVLGVAGNPAWQTFKAVRAGRSTEDQAFVAMWFHPDMSPAWEQGIKPALEDCGYVARRIDRHEHNNKIEDEIIAQIRKSKLVIADFTGGRGGVYYEAGFAHGLGREVIHCCGSESRFPAFTISSAPSMEKCPPGEALPWFKQVAFDNNHHNFILWDDPADLREKLTKRIQALGWDLPKRTPSE